MKKRVVNAQVGLYFILSNTETDRGRRAFVLSMRMSLNRQAEFCGHKGVDLHLDGQQRRSVAWPSDQRVYRETLTSERVTQSTSITIETAMCSQLYLSLAKFFPRSCCSRRDTYANITKKRRPQRSTI